MRGGSRRGTGQVGRKGAIKTDFEVRHRRSKEIFRTFGFVIGTVIPLPQETFCKDLHSPFQFGELKSCSFSALEKSLKREKSGPVIAGLSEYK